MITMAPTWEIVAFLDQVPYRSFTRAVVGKRLRWGFLNLQIWLLAIPRSAWELPPWCSPTNVPCRNPFPLLVREAQ